MGYNLATKQQEKYTNLDIHWYDTWCFSKFAFQFIYEASSIKTLTIGFWMKVSNKHLAGYIQLIQLQDELRYWKPSTGSDVQSFQTWLPVVKNKPNLAPLYCLSFLPHNSTSHAIIRILKSSLECLCLDLRLFNGYFRSLRWSLDTTRGWETHQEKNLQYVCMWKQLIECQWLSWWICQAGEDSTVGHAIDAVFYLRFRLFSLSILLLITFITKITLRICKRLTEQNTAKFSFQVKIKITF